MAAIYLRVSTDHDEQKRSPEHQWMTCVDHATELGLHTDKRFVYNDAGQSGTEMSHRKAVQRLITDARDGKFDAVLFTAISRFARDLSDALALKKRLETVYGIRIISVEEGYDSAIDGRNSEMIFTVHAMVAAHKSHEMSKAIRRGLRQSAVSGRHIGNIAPFGYMKTRDKRLIPDPQTADTIRLIFHLYCCGLGTTAIAKELNRRKIPTARSSHSHPMSLWQPSSVNAILHNPVYIGTLVANRWRRGVDVAKSRRVDAQVKRQMIRLSDEWVVIEHNHEAIIDPSTYHKVQEMLQRKSAHRGIRRNTNILAGVLRCAHCGKAMVITGSGGTRSHKYKYVVCSSVKRLGKDACANHVRVPYLLLLEAVVSPLRRMRASATCVDKLSASFSTDNQGITERVEQLHRQIALAKQKRTEALRAYTEALCSEQEYRDLRGELSEEILRRTDEMNRLLRQQELTTNPLPAQLEAFLSRSVFDKHHFDNDEPLRLALHRVLLRIEFSRDRTIHIVYRWQPERAMDNSSLDTSLT